MITRDALQDYCAKFLDVGQFKDYCPNGLQVQGKSEIRKVVSGVTACEELLDAAVKRQADAVLVHHGYFWRGESPSLVGAKYRRIAKLIRNDMNLFAYHLPLDAHPDVGNNAQLANKLGLAVSQRCGRDNLLFVHESDKELSAAAVHGQLNQVLGRTPLIVGAQPSEVRKIAWCTGAAQSFIDDAIEVGAEIFISGEISENTVHTARENNIQYIAAGHHATERYGVQALAEHLAEKFSLEHEFVDIDNPV